MAKREENKNFVGNIMMKNASIYLSLYTKVISPSLNVTHERIFSATFDTFLASKVRTSFKEIQRLINQKGTVLCFCLNETMATKTISMLY